MSLSLTIEHLRKVYKKGHAKRVSNRRKIIRGKMRELSDILRTNETRNQIINAAKEGKRNLKVMEISCYPEFFDWNYPEYQETRKLLHETCQKSGLSCGVHKKEYIYVFGWS